MTKTVYPLSSPQKEIWLEHLLHPDVPFHIIGCYISVEAEIDPARFRHIAQQLVKAHDSLRAALEPGEDHHLPGLRFEDDLCLDIPYVDLSGEPDPEAVAHKRMNELFIKPFDLTRAPLFEYQLFRVRPKLHYWFMRYHHLIIDGWAGALVARMASALYAEQVTLEPGPSYVEFIEDDQRYVQSEQWEQSRAFWSEQFANWPAPLVSVRYPQHIEDGLSRCAFHRFQLSQELSSHLKTISKASGVSRFQIIAGALCVMLARTYQRDELSMGLPVLNRADRRSRELVGMVTNIIPMRVQVDPERDISAVLLDIQKSLSEILPHQRFPLGELKRLAGRRGATQTRLYDVAFSYNNHSFVCDFGTGARNQMHALLHPYEQTPLFIHARQLSPDAPMVFEFVYNLAYFSLDEVQRMERRFLHLLSSDPGQTPVGRLPLIPPDEAHTLAQWSAGPPLPGALPGLVERFEAQARRTPEAIALLCEGEQLSYDTLDRRANQLARFLLQAVAPADEERLVGIALERSPALLVAVLAVLKAGMAYVPLDPGYPPQRLARMAKISDLALVLTEPHLAEALPEEIAPRVLLSNQREEIERLPDAPPEIAPNARRLAYVLFTSGSTGEPKGVMIEDGNASAMVQWAIDHFDRRWFAGMLASTSLNFDLSVFELFAPLAAGGAVVLVRDALSLIDCVHRDCVTFVNTVPSAMTELLRVGALPSGVRAVGLAGEPLPRELAEAVYAHEGVEAVFNLYGPSEDTTYSTWSRVERGSTSAPSIGRPIAGTTALVLDARREPLPIDAVGELYLGGAGLARGYLHRPDLTDERFVIAPGDGQRLYRTGDRVRWRSDGVLEFLGRIDHQIKLRGFRIELGEIESRLTAADGVEEAVVAAHVTRDDHYLVAWFTGQPHPPAELRAWLAMALPSYMVPARFVHLDAMPRTPNGKLDRAALPNPDGGDVELKDAPQTPTEVLLAEHWCALLDRRAVGRHDDFFELGGHSLLVLRLVARIEAAFDARPTLRALFENSTLHTQARYLDTCRSALSDVDEAESAADTDAAPLSFIQQRLWFLDRLEGESATYNMPGAFRLRGTLDEDALTSALKALVARHDGLRARFPERDGRPEIEWIAPYSPLETASVESSSVRELIDAHASRPFDLREGPLFRATLLREGPEDHVLMLNLHHIIADGESVGILFRDLSALYDAFHCGAQPALPPVKMNYVDYARWRRQRLSTPDVEARLDDTVRTLSGAPDLLALPTDRPRSASSVHRGGVVARHLPDDLLDAANRLGANHRVTLFMTFLSTLQILLARYSGQLDFCIGAPLSDRSLDGSEDVVGPFLRTLALRASLDLDQSFTDVLAQARQRCLEAFAQQDVPFERLVERLSPRRDRGYAPLFQVMLVMDRAVAAAPSFKNVEVERIDAPHPFAKFDLVLVITEGTQGLTCRWEYSRDLFDEERIERLSAHFEALLRAALAQPEQRIGALPMLTNSERVQLTAWATGTRISFPHQTLVEAFGADLPEPGAQKYPKSSVT